MRMFIALLGTFILFVTFAAAQEKKPPQPKPADPKVIGPIVGQAVKGDTSKPLRELAAEAERAKAEAEKQLDAPTKAIRKVLQEKYRNTGENATIARLIDGEVAAVFPKSNFYTLRFRQYPVSFEVPAGLSAGNVCVVDGSSAIILPNAKALEQFFIKSQAAVKDNDQRRAAAKAWLRLSQEIHSDGFYQFKSIDASSISIEEGKVSGTSVVVPVGGNQGQIQVTMKFDSNGKLVGADEIAELKPGVRPICQATKLLDADPIVRRMAERDILVMGRYSLNYLLEQRAKAPPHLQEMIDAAWQQIVREGR